VQMNRLDIASAEQCREGRLATLNRRRRKRAFTFFCAAVCLFFARAREEANFRANWYAPLNYQTKMMPTIDALLRRWHGMLGLSRQSQSWYRARLREELHELRNAKTPLLKLSETSDVVFSSFERSTMAFPFGSSPLLPLLNMSYCTRTWWQNSLHAGHSTERLLCFAEPLVTTWCARW
jgi:hypothetical protein